MTMSPREAAWTIHYKTGAAITPCTLHERSGDMAGWIVTAPHEHGPRLYNDAELVAWAAELDGIEDAHGTGHKDLAAVA